MPVHLYGQVCDMDPIMEIARKNSMYIVEGCVQPHGAKCKGKVISPFGDARTTVTNNEEIVKKVRALVNCGSDYKYHHIYQGNNSRLDELQVAFL